MRERWGSWERMKGTYFLPIDPPENVDRDKEPDPPRTLAYESGTIVEADLGSITLPRVRPNESEPEEFERFESRDPPSGAEYDLVRSCDAPSSRERRREVSYVRVMQVRNCCVNDS